jgi:3-deoxy-D-manno-octulosonate 8-phosphate phosphatase (KDO 8-P phosphatase)
MANLPRDEYEARLRGLKLVATDVDGVLTDGSIAYTGADLETKVFNVRDGSAVYIARAIGIPVVVVTARSSEAVARRFAELPVQALYQGTFDKVTACMQAESQLGIGAEEIAFLGDDLVDLPAIRRAGLGVAVADAHPQVRAAADWVLSTRGGRGAFRELIDDIVGARDLWDSVLADYEDRQARKGVVAPEQGSGAD